MNIIKFSLIFFLFAVVVMPLQAQFYSFNQHIKYADASFEKAHYLEALKHYTLATEMNDKLSEEELYRMAESAFLTNSLSLADSLYRKFTAIDSSRQDEVLYKLADIKLKQGLYDEAIINYNLYLSEFGDRDSIKTNEVERLKSSALWATSSDIESLVDSVKPYPGNVNTPYSEHAPYFYNEELYYSSTQFIKNREEGDTYTSQLLRTGGAQINFESIPEVDYVSHPTFTPDGKFLVYSLCQNGEQTDINCQLAYSLVNSDTSFSQTVVFPDPINFSASSNAQATFTYSDKGYKMYYASDRKDGMGGQDIWVAELDTFMQIKSTPENLGAVNTKYDEMSPFYHINSNKFYFSSNGRDGYGGYDVYMVKDLDSDEISNLGDVVNTPLNEVFFSLNESGSEVYFSSNKPESQYLDSSFESCCYDIYTGEITECTIDLLALTFDNATKESLKGVRIEVKRDTDGEVVYSEVLDSTNTHEIEVDCESNYIVSATKDGYENQEVTISADKVSYGQTNEMIRKIYLDPSIYDLRLMVYDQDTRRPLDSLDFVLKNLTTGELVEISKHPSNELSFEVDPNTDYEITVNRRGYIERIETFNSGVGSPIIEKEILLEEKEIIRKAKVSLANAIPVQLYFDHDEPDRGTMRMTSTQNYTNTYYKYYNRKSLYTERYPKRFGGSQRTQALDEINDFFESYVKKGYDKYEVFKNQLILVLESGQKVNIYLRGYASPIAQNEYNTALGKRRVDSVRREFDEWNDGALLPYIQSGQLTVTERSFGEDTSPKEVSDDPGRPSQSIYSPGASKERRVEIDEINFNQN